jgi:POT family proton-dependent oligopeptide transporter
MFRGRIFRLLLPLGLVMFLTVVVGLPDTDSHASSDDSEESEEPDEKDVKAAKPKWDETPAPVVATQFMSHIGAGRYDEAYQAASPLLRRARRAQELKNAMVDAGLSEVVSVEWSNGVPITDGFRLDGEVTLKGGETLPVYAAVLQEGTGLNAPWHVLDVQSTESFTSRIANGAANGLDWLIAMAMLALLGAFGFIIYKYVNGLRGSPRELYLLFFTKVTEYSAYGAANMTFVLYLHSDLGLSDIAAGSYIGAWSMGLTLLTMVVGAVCDAIGVKRTLLIGCYCLLISRFFMPLLDDIILTSVLGFLPLAIGIAITGPVLSVGIKLFTTRAGSTLGFGLFYTLMNVGWAIGAWIFDAVRGVFGDNATHTFAIVGDMSTYQIIIAVGFFLTIPDLIAISLMRRGVDMTENGVRIKAFADKGEGPMAKRIADLVVTSTKDTAAIFSSVFRQRAFYVFLFMVGLLVFVRLTFYHFHYTFPTYGIRVFGEGVKIGSIFGVLNPVMIIFLVPLIAAMTTKIRSYYMLIIGSAISAGSVFIATIDPSHFAFLADTWFGTLVFDRWLEIPIGRRDPFYLSLVVFIFFFTIGEAIWSPRLMQFTAEIAPPGREGSYIALGYLPYFGAKFIAGPMSGWLVSTYTPEGAESFPDHYMVWIWIGGMALISPLGMVFFRRLYRKAEDDAEAAAESAANDLVREQTDEVNTET